MLSHFNAWKTLASFELQQILLLLACPQNQEKSMRHMQLDSNVPGICCERNKEASRSETPWQDATQHSKHGQTFAFRHTTGFLLQL